MSRRSLKRAASLLLSLALVLTLSMTLFASALSDGAYLVSRSTSYADPETGKTVDGGTDIALGDSMCASITESQALVEQSGGKTYVTIGLGLMSNISNVRIAVQNSGSSYSPVSITKTGSHQRDDDTCNHYRFPMKDPSKRIRVTFYVAPMSRDVTYFVTLNMNSAKPGTGVFKSEMVKTSGSEAATKAASRVTTAAGKVTTKGSVTKANTYSQDLYGEEDDASEARDSSDSFSKVMIGFVIGVVALVLLGIILMIVVAKKRH